jgi:hypothetical protein
VVKESQNTAGYHQYLGIVSKQTPAPQSTTWKWLTKAETAGTTGNADELASRVPGLELASRSSNLDRTPRGGAAPRRRLLVHLKDCDTQPSVVEIWFGEDRLRVLQRVWTIASLGSAAG